MRLDQRAAALVERTECFLAGQCDRRGRHVEDRIDFLVVIPVAGDADADVGLVLMVGRDHLDGLARHPAAVIGNRYLHGGKRAFARGVGIEARDMSVRTPTLTTSSEICAFAAPLEAATAI